MANLKLEANYRTDLSKGRNNRLRREGYATGSIVSRGQDTIPVEVKVQDVIDEIKKSDAGIKALIDMKINGAPTTDNAIVIIKGFVKDPISRKVLDIEFHEVHMKELVHVGVPIVLIGEAPGIKEGAIIEQNLDELQVSCLPGNIPSKIEVDISNLGSGEHIRVGDISVGEGIKVLADEDANIVACVSRQRGAKEEEEAAAATEAAE